MNLHNKVESQRAGGLQHGVNVCVVCLTCPKRVDSAPPHRESHEFYYGLLYQQLHLHREAVRACVRACVDSPPATFPRPQHSQTEQHTVRARSRGDALRPVAGKSRTPSSTPQAHTSNLLNVTPSLSRRRRDSRRSRSHGHAAPSPVDLRPTVSAGEGDAASATSEHSEADMPVYHHLHPTRAH